MRFVGVDVIELFQTMALADWKVTLSEQESLPRPYREAVSWAKHAIDRAKAEAVKQSRSPHG